MDKPSHQENHVVITRMYHVQVPVMSDISTPLSPLPASGDWRYRPCLPQRGCPSEPHYSVPRNNARVDTASWNSSSNEMDKTPTNEAGRMLETLEKVEKQNIPFFHF